MATKIIIKQVPLDECLKINRLISEFNRERYTYNYFADRYKGKNPLLLAAYQGKKPTGYMISYDKYNDGSYYCWMAGVIPEYRNKGILKKMMVYLEATAKKQGYASIKLTTRNERRHMLAFLVKYRYNIINFEPQPRVERHKSIWEKIL